MLEEKPYCRSTADIRFLFGISRSEIYRRLGTGEFRAIKVGRRTLVIFSSVEEYFDRLPAATFSPKRQVVKSQVEIMRTPQNTARSAPARRRGNLTPNSN